MDEVGVVFVDESPTVGPPAAPPTAAVDEERDRMAPVATVGGAAPSGDGAAGGTDELLRSPREDLDGARTNTGDVCHESRRPSLPDDEGGTWCCCCRLYTALSSACSTAGAWWKIGCPGVY